jgi:hypothetical protein
MNQPIARPQYQMQHLTIGDTQYRVIYAMRDGQWTARAGLKRPAIRSASSAAAPAKRGDRPFDRLASVAERARRRSGRAAARRAGHRTIAGSAFASPTEGPTAIELQKESLGSRSGAGPPRRSPRATARQSGNRVIG